MCLSLDLCQSRGAGGEEQKSSLATSIRSVIYPRLFGHKASTFSETSFSVHFQKQCDCEVVLRVIRASSRKVASLISYGVITTFNLHNPSGHIMVQGSNQRLTEMSTRYISWVVKVAGA